MKTRRQTKRDKEKKEPIMPNSDSDNEPPIRGAEAQAPNTEPSAEKAELNNMFMSTMIELMAENKTHQAEQGKILQSIHEGQSKAQEEQTKVLQTLLETMVNSQFQQSQHETIEPQPMKTATDDATLVKQISKHDHDVSENQSIADEKADEPFEITQNQLDILLLQAEDAGRRKAESSVEQDKVHTENTQISNTERDLQNIINRATAQVAENTAAIFIERIEKLEQENKKLRKQQEMLEAAVSDHDETLVYMKEEHPQSSQYFNRKIARPDEPSVSKQYPAKPKSEPTPKRKIMHPTGKHIGSLIKQEPQNSSNSSSESEKILEKKGKKPKTKTVLRKKSSPKIIIQESSSESEQNESDSDIIFPSDSSASGDEGEQVVHRAYKARIPPERQPKLPPYDGKRPWEEWFTRLEEIGKRRGWTDAQKLDILAEKLQGEAASFAYGQLTASTRSNYKKFSRELSSRFRTLESTRAFQAQFNNRNQRYNETPRQYADELRKLYSKAYPGRSEKTRQEDLLRKFTEGLYSSKMRHELVNFKLPRTIDEAVSHVIEMSQTMPVGIDEEENFMVARVNANPPDNILIEQYKQLSGKVEKLEELVKETLRPASDQNTPGNDSKNNGKRTAIQCHYCGKNGHMFRDCRKRMWDIIRKTPRQNQNSGKSQNMATANNMPQQGSAATQMQGLVAGLPQPMPFTMQPAPPNPWQNQQSHQAPGHNIQTQQIYPNDQGVNRQARDSPNKQ